MEGEFGSIDAVTLGRYANQHPNSGDAAAELMKRSLEDNPMIKGVDRRNGNEIVFIQPERGPPFSDYGDDYDFDLSYITTVEKTNKKLPETQDRSGEIVVTLQVRGIRKQYSGRTRPDYSRNGTRYEGTGSEPEPLKDRNEDAGQISPVSIDPATSKADLDGNYTGIVDRVVDGNYIVFELVENNSSNDGAVVGSLTIEKEDITRKRSNLGTYYDIHIDEGMIKSIEKR